MKSRHWSGPMADGLCAAGLTVRDIRAYLKDVHGRQVSPDLISRVTDAEPEEVRELSDHHSWRFAGQDPRRRQPQGRVQSVEAPLAQAQWRTQSASLSA